MRHEDLRKHLTISYYNNTHDEWEDSRPITDFEFDALAREWAVENGYVKREEMERAVEAEHERGNRYADALLEDFRGARSGWVKVPDCDECGGSGVISGEGGWSDFVDPTPCPSCGGTGKKRMVALDGIDVEGLREAIECLNETEDSRRARYAVADVLAALEGETDAHEHGVVQQWCDDCGALEGQTDE